MMTTSEKGSAMDYEKKQRNGEWTIRLYRTEGKRHGTEAGKGGFKRCCLVLYFAIELDWTYRNLERNGNGRGTELFVAKPPPAAIEYYLSMTRAHSLRYSGVGKQNERGLREDLETLGFDETTVNSFLQAAKPYWPMELTLKENK
jgi:hypothetical protein